MAPKAYELAKSVQMEKTVSIAHIIGVEHGCKNVCKDPGQDVINEEEPPATITSADDNRHFCNVSSSYLAQPAKKSKQS